MYFGCGMRDCRSASSDVPFWTKVNNKSTTKINMASQLTHGACMQHDAPVDACKLPCWKGRRARCCRAGNRAHDMRGLHPGKGLPIDGQGSAELPALAGIIQQEEQQSAQPLQQQQQHAGRARRLALAAAEKRPVKRRKTAGGAGWDPGMPYAAAGACTETTVAAQVRLTSSLSASCCPLLRVSAATRVEGVFECLVLLVCAGMQPQHLHEHPSGPQYGKFCRYPWKGGSA